VIIRYPTGYTITASAGITHTVTTDGDYDVLVVTAGGASDTITFGN
jgi:hypothetical protein